MEIAAATDSDIPVDDGTGWVVVTSGAKQYIGKQLTEGGYDKVASGYIALRPVYEIKDMTIPMPSPDGKGVSLQRTFACLPIGVTLYGMATMVVRFNDLMYLSDLKEGDIAEYLKLVDMAQRRAAAERFARSGLVRVENLSIDGRPLGRG